MWFSRNDRKIKLLAIIALVIALVGISFGFASFSMTLNISSSVSVSPNSDIFSVKFSTNKDLLVVDTIKPSAMTEGINVKNGVIDNSANPTAKNLHVKFTSPGQYVEYTFYARNEGIHTAYLIDINFTGNKTCTAEVGTTDYLAQRACDFINISVFISGVEYTETTSISNHVLEKDMGEEIKIRLSYSSNGSLVDGPFLITFPNVELVYSSLDNSINPPVDDEEEVELGRVISIHNEKFYVMGIENGNVKLLSMYNLYVGNTFDYKNELVAISNPTGIQNSKAKGFFDEFSVVSPIVGIIDFAPINYWDSDGLKEEYGVSYPAYVYDMNSNLYKYINNYKEYLKSFGVNIVSARLVTRKEVEDLGCNIEENTCSGAPGWVWSTTYWTGTAEDNGLIWIVGTNTHFYARDYTSSNDYGVRPVIEIPFSDYEKM